MKHVALITGASSGIGRELARVHAANGGDLVLIARRTDRLEELEAELANDHGISILTISEDLNDEGSPIRIYDRVRERGIAVECLINNAGFGAHGLFHEQDWAANRAMIQVNVVALAALTRLFLPDFAARNSGRIMNVSSTASLSPGPLQAVYFASKAFVSSLTNALAEELSDTGITVTNFMPTATETEFAARSGMDKTRLFRSASSPRQVAQEGYDAMMRGDLDAFGGMRPKRRVQQMLLGLLPKRTAMRLVRSVQEAA